MDNTLKKISYLLLTVFISFLLTSAFLLVISNKKKNVSSQLIDFVVDPMQAFSDGRMVFKTNCASCHKINKKSTPDLLLHLESKMSRDYFYLFITKQDSLIESKDQYTVENSSYSFFNTVAINHRFYKDLDKKDVSDLYDYIIAVKSR